MYALTTIIVFLAIPLGCLLAFHTKEEIVKGKKYLHTASLLLYSILGVLLVYWYLTKELFPQKIQYVLLAALAILFGVFFFALQKQKTNISVFFGVLLYLASKDVTLFTWTASLLFVLFLPLTSTFVAGVKGSKKEIVVQAMKAYAMVLIAVPLYFLN
jgi:hypothetical protein